MKKTTCLKCIPVYKQESYFKNEATECQNWLITVQKVFALRMFACQQ